MKRRFFLLSVIAFFFLMLIFPQPVFDGASKGLLLWFNVVLPTLLPFIILSNLLISTRAINWIARITGPVFCRFFRVSGYGSFAILSGFLCGYPMGSKVTADLLRAGHISSTEGQYLLSFCNNTSPMFIISYLLLQNLKNEPLKLPVIVILMISPVICSFLFRKYYICPLPAAHKSSDMTNLKDQAEISPNPSSLIDTCIMNGFETITKVGGYIMLFSILGELILPLLNTCPDASLSIFRYFLIPFLEITKGISSLCASQLSEPVKFLLCMALTSFGGWCSVAQTKCMIQGTALRIAPYITQKLATALVTSLLSCVYLIFT